MVYLIPINYFYYLISSTHPFREKVFLFYSHFETKYFLYNYFEKSFSFSHPFCENFLLFTSQRIVHGYFKKVPQQQQPEQHFPLSVLGCAADKKKIRNRTANVIEMKKNILFELSFFKSFFDFLAQHFLSHLETWSLDCLDLVSSRDFRLVTCLTTNPTGHVGDLPVQLACLQKGPAVLPSDSSESSSTISNRLSRTTPISRHWHGTAKVGGFFFASDCVRG